MGPQELPTRPAGLRLRHVLRRAARAPPMDCRDNRHRRILHHTKWCILLRPAVYFYSGVDIRVRVRPPILPRTFGVPNSSWTKSLNTVAFRRISVARARTETVMVALSQRKIRIRVENSHQPVRRRERTMTKFEGNMNLQNLASVHASTHSYFNQDRHLDRRKFFKQTSAAALAEWCEPMARGSLP